MDILQAAILGLIEGITEFLPVSSTGHMVLASSLLHISEIDFLKTFEIVIQLGAIFAVIMVSFQKLIRHKELLPKIIAAFIPTGLIGLMLYKIIKQYLLGNNWITVAALGVGGIVFIVLELLLKNKIPKTKSSLSVTYQQAVLIGIAQSFSIIPGISRSAASIFGAMCSGLSREAAVEFSFFLAIPTMIAATGLDLIKSDALLYPSSILLLFIGSSIAFLSAFIVVKIFMKYIQNHTFIPFGVYRIILALTFTFFFLH